MDFSLRRGDWINSIDPEFGVIHKEKSAASLLFFYSNHPFESELSSGCSKQKNPSLQMDFSFCRGDWIRTSDPQHPMLIRYQTALRPE